jgi:hypothetical protein
MRDTHIIRMIAKPAFPVIGLCGWIWNDSGNTIFLLFTPYGALIWSSNGNEKSLEKEKQNNLCLSELASVKTDVLYAGGVDTGI